MMPLILATCTRSISSFQRAIIKNPKNGRKLVTNAQALFIRTNYTASVGDPPLKIINRLRKKFQQLSTEDRAAYEDRARFNKQIADARKSTFKSVRTTGYGLFVKERYARIAQDYRGTSIERFRAISQALSSAWKSLSEREKMKYREMATKKRACAVVERQRMVKDSRLVRHRR
mmetsp:Transcript_4210/g.6319  ORF Transcript_4210/g.6319 Transcript_4210/m.6319 type:complete len:174 (-) Transcript_4210:1396-1917(-)